MKKTLVLLLSIVCCWNSFGQSIMLDKSFGKNGMAVYPYKNAIVHSIIQLPEKEVLSSINAPTTGNKYMSIVYKVDSMGNPNTTFGENGVSQDTSLSSAFSYLFVNPSGRMYATGESPRSFVACYDSNGKKINSFGKSGLLLIDPIPQINDFFIYGISSYSDNGFIVCYCVDISRNYVSGYSTILAKYDSTGCLDKQFGENGMLTRSSNFKFILKRFFVLSDGCILCTGESYFANNNNKMCLLKLRPDGQPDSTFGVEGKVICDIDTVGGTDMTYMPYEESACDVIELEDHRLLISVVSTKTNNDFIIRMLPDGKLDKSFGVNGISPAFNKIKGFTTLKDNSILVNVNNAVCLTPDGLPDKNIVIDPLLKYLNCLVAQKDGTIWAGTYMKDSTNQYLPAMAKFVYNTETFIPDKTLQTSRVNVFPTVFKNALTLSSDNEIIQSVSIYNLQGQCFFTQTCNDRNITLNLQLPANLYLCKIKTTGGVCVQKVISGER